MYMAAILIPTFPSLTGVKESVTCFSGNYLTRRKGDNDINNNSIFSCSSFYYHFPLSIFPDSMAHSLNGVALCI